MRCPSCQTTAPIGARFCPSCGGALPATCPDCGRDVPADARFCPSCGSALGGDPTTAPAPRSAVVLPEDQTRLLTVLFADLSGSVAAVHGLDPEASAARVNEVLAVMARVVGEHEGGINRYLGDGVLAVFGAHRAHEDDPIRAISAALAIRDELRRRGFESTAGINTGEVYLGRIGSDEHREFSAMGPVINLAARFQSLAEPGQILIGEATWRSARRAFDFETLTLDVKGVTAPVRAYAVVGRRPHPAIARGLEEIRAELIGRADELARLERALTESTTGHGRVVTLMGDAGVGKSRLVGELEQHAAVEAAVGGAELLWLEGRCLESTMAAAYHPFVDLLRGYFIGDDEDPSVRSGRVETVLIDLADRDLLPRERLVDVVPLLRRLLSADDPSDYAILRDAPPQQIKTQTLMAVRDLFLALARERPVVVVLEDLHWADSLSLDLVSFLFSSLADAPHLLLCTYRLDPHHKSRHLSEVASQKASGRHVAIELHELALEDSVRLLDSLLDVEGLPLKVRAEILEKSQGNPLFLEEVVRSMIDAGEIVREDGKWRAVSGATRISVPETVQSITLSRIDRLDEELRRVLQAASVVGRIFPRGLVVEVLGTDVGLDRALWQLEQLGLVYLDRVVPEEEYSFKHVFTRDTVYRSLLKNRRAALHLAVARAIERLYPDRIDENVDRLAHHYDHAESPEKAVEYLIAAGEKAAAAFSNEEAVTYLRRARERLAALGSDPAREPWAAPLRIRIAERLGDVYERVGRHEEGEEAFAEALTRLPEEDGVLRARLLRKLGASRQLQRKAAESLAALEAATAALERAGPDRPEWWAERLEIELVRYAVLYFTGAVAELEERFETTRSELEAHATPVQRGRLYQCLSMVGFRKERYVLSDETVRIAHAAVEAIEDGGHLSDIAHARFGYGFSLMWSGRLAEAEAEMLDALALADRIGDVTTQSRCTTYLALTRRKLDDVAGTRWWAERALELAETSGMLEYTAIGKAHMAWVAWREGDLAAADRWGSEALAIWKERLPGPYVLFAWMPVWPLLGVAWKEGRLDAAAEHARFLLDPARQPMPRDVRAALEAALEAAARGERDGARGRIAEALSLARQQGYA